jgi:predicted DNA binding protein
MADAGLRVVLSVGSPGDCPVATVANGSAEGVAWTDGEPVVEEFRADPETVDDDADPGVSEVFRYDDESVYQLERDPKNDCVCERVTSLDCPVADVTVDDGRLELTFHAAGAEQFRAVLDDLRDAYDDVTVESILRTPPEGDDADPVVVDRGRLTARQAEVLATAHEMGYFEYPRESNATEVAESLGIGPSTLAEHLAAAESKLVGQTID